jgi:hypothetical protein
MARKRTFTAISAKHYSEFAAVSPVMVTADGWLKKKIAQVAINNHFKKLIISTFI